MQLAGGSQTNSNAAMFIQQNPTSPQRKLQAQLASNAPNNKMLYVKKNAKQMNIIYNQNQAN